MRHDSNPFLFPAFFIEFDESFWRLVFPFRQLFERRFRQRPILRQRRQSGEVLSLTAFGSLKIFFVFHFRNLRQGHDDAAPKDHVRLRDWHVEQIDF